MDKEAQEKIVVFLGIAQEAGKRGVYFDVWDNAGILLNELQKLGYRKLPKDKPPLLSEGQVKLWKSEELNIPLSLTALCGIDYSAAQRKADIKHYED